MHTTTVSKLLTRSVARAYFLRRFTSQGFVLTTVVVEKGVDCAFTLGLAAFLVLLGMSLSWIDWSYIGLSLVVLIRTHKIK